MNNCEKCQIPLLDMMIGFYSKNLQIQELFSFLIKRGTIFLIALYLQIFSPAKLQAPNATVSQIIAKDKGGASLSDVGLLHNEHAHTRQEDKAVRGQKLGTLRSKHARACLQSEQIDCVPTITYLNLVRGKKIAFYILKSKHRI